MFTTLRNTSRPSAASAFAKRRIGSAAARRMRNGAVTCTSMHRLELLVGHLLDDAVPGVAGVVDDDVEAAEAVERGRTNRSGNAGSVTLPAQDAASPPAARIAATVSSAGSSSRSFTTTRAPSAASLSAIGPADAAPGAGHRGRSFLPACSRTPQHVGPAALTGDGRAGNGASRAWRRGRRHPSSGRRALPGERVAQAVDEPRLDQHAAARVAVSQDGITISSCFAARRIGPHRHSGAAGDGGELGDEAPDPAGTATASFSPCVTKSGMGRARWPMSRRASAPSESAPEPPASSPPAPTRHRPPSASPRRNVRRQRRTGRDRRWPRRRPWPRRRRGRRRTAGAGRAPLGGHLRDQRREQRGLAVAARLMPREEPVPALERVGGGGLVRRNDDQPVLRRERIDPRCFRQGRRGLGAAVQPEEQGRVAARTRRHVEPVVKRAVRRGVDAIGGKRGGGGRVCGRARQGAKGHPDCGDGADTIAAHTLITSRISSSISPAVARVTHDTTKKTSDRRHQRQAGDGDTLRNRHHLEERQRLEDRA